MDGNRFHSDIHIILFAILMFKEIVRTKSMISV